MTWSPIHILLILVKTRITGHLTDNSALCLMSARQALYTQKAPCRQQPGLCDPAVLLLKSQPPPFVARSEGRVHKQPDGYKVCGEGL